MKTILLLLITVTSYGQFFAPSLTAIYQEGTNKDQSGLRYGMDMKYFAIHGDKEYFFDWAYAYGEDRWTDTDLMRLGFGCKTGQRLKYGMMGSIIGYRLYNYPESMREDYTVSMAFSPLVSYDLNKYFYIESGMTLTAFQKGDFEVANSYFFSFGMRWY